MRKVFIDGSAGTTGLRIYQRLSERNDIELIHLDEAVRKDANARKNALNSCDIAFLCLPDDAAREAVQMTDNEDVTIIDTSTAHRTLEEWAYGFPELSDKHYKSVASSKRIAVPGCHASGFIALVYPLVENGIISSDALLSCFSLTGYSGGGKKMIAQYEDSERSPLLGAPRQYGITQMHKHLKEMKAITGIKNEPAFCPIVADFYSGMEVSLTIFKEQLSKGFNKNDICDAYSSKYNTDIVKFVPSADEEGFLSAGALSGKDSMQISVFGNDDRILLAARYDNLGKGASGAALECMNISMGIEPGFMLDI